MKKGEEKRKEEEKTKMRDRNSSTSSDEPPIEASTSVLALAPDDPTSFSG